MKKIFNNFFLSSIFVKEIEIKNSRVLWFTVGSYMTYNYFSSYLQYCEKKTNIFKKNYSKIHEKFQEAHFQASKGTLSLEGYPDQGDWIYSKELNAEDLQELLKYKENFEDNLNEYCIIFPLYIVSGLWAPVLTSCLGSALIFVNSKLSKDNNNENMQFYKKIVICSLILNSFFSSFGVKFYP